MSQVSYEDHNREHHNHPEHHDHRRCRHRRPSPLVLRISSTTTTSSLSSSSSSLNISRPQLKPSLTRATRFTRAVNHRRISSTINATIPLPSSPSRVARNTHNVNDRLPLIRPWGRVSSSHGHSNSFVIVSRHEEKIFPLLTS